uniref:EF-hand domain-containing protein n=1 Tax=Chromera velia CCMP2878 TaxID=1169474 RepID=A0A0G4I7K4_9ALVE|eukprot:Cvel_11690.t1-p1 / transcript=Cvel_11690.t1 / gene=Cvel_11690 / organism=Chromera_velia_CCMP2878 / gene_product=hypothetical protein / transcript_product=hypothetical protein / location=Cvel_scaffold741:26225-27244(-) / protein_length=340 / sequence_SO=supercontig / SO=protein_coding / is_pseudo=false
MLTSSSPDVLEVLISLRNQMYGKVHVVRLLIKTFNERSEAAKSGFVSRVELEHVLVSCGLFLSQPSAQQLYRAVGGNWRVLVENLIGDSYTADRKMLVERLYDHFAVPVEGAEEPMLCLTGLMEAAMVHNHPKAASLSRHPELLKHDLQRALEGLVESTGRTDDKIGKTEFHAFFRGISATFPHAHESEFADFVQRLWGVWPVRDDKSEKLIKAQTKLRVKIFQCMRPPQTEAEFLYEAFRRSDLLKTPDFVADWRTFNDALAYVDANFSEEETLILFHHFVECYPATPSEARPPPVDAKGEPVELIDYKKLIAAFCEGSHPNAVETSSHVRSVQHLFVH